MKKKLIFILGFLSALLAIGAFIYGQQDAIADVLGIRSVLNSPGNNATTTVATNTQGISVIPLRYVLNGATTTLPTASTTAETNQNGINVADAQSITLAYMTVGSTSPYTARFEIEYGFDLPIGTNPQRTSLQWFKHNFPIVGPTLGYNFASTSNLSITELSSSTPLIIRTNLGTATTSEMIEIPTHNARYMRIHAAALGSDAMFWLNAIIRDYKR